MDNTTQVDYCLLNLKIISKLEENDKLITNQDILKIDKPVLFQGVKRWYSKEGRETTMAKLNDIYNESFKITDNILADEKNDQKENSNLKILIAKYFKNLLLNLQIHLMV